MLKKMLVTSIFSFFHNVFGLFLKGVKNCHCGVKDQPPFFQSLTPLLQKKQPGRVPVCSSLEMVSGVLPKFSSCFYFEVLKTCSWTHLFVEVLQSFTNSNCAPTN